jgi:hypothetical protein
MGLREEAIDKIKALRRKAEAGSGATEAEVDAAIAAAQKLMVKHMLSESDVAKAASESDAMQTFSMPTDERVYQHYLVALGKLFGVGVGFGFSNPQFQGLPKAILQGRKFNIELMLEVHQEIELQVHDKFMMFHDKTTDGRIMRDFLVGMFKRMTIRLFDIYHGTLDSKLPISLEFDSQMDQLMKKLNDRGSVVEDRTSEVDLNPESLEEAIGHVVAETININKRV